MKTTLPDDYRYPIHFCVDPVEARFVGGALAGTRMKVDMSQHYWTDRASGHHYRRSTHPRGRELLYIFTWHGLTIQQIQEGLEAEILKP